MADKRHNRKLIYINLGIKKCHENKSEGDYSYARTPFIVELYEMRSNDFK